MPGWKSAIGVAVVSVTVLSTSLSAFSEPRCLRVVNVDFWDVLYIRSQQTHRSKAVGAIAPDHDGIIELKGPCMPAGQSPRRQWCPVNYYPLPSVRISGYVKAYFIAASACPKGFVGAS
jgi:hypothetical protein